PGALPVVGPGEAELRPGAVEHVGNALLRGGVVRPGDARLARLKRARLDGAVNRLKRGLVSRLVDALLLKEFAEDLIASVGGEFVVDRRFFALLRLGLRVLRGALAGERKAADPRSEADKAREAHGRAPFSTGSRRCPAARKRSAWRPAGAPRPASRRSRPCASGSRTASRGSRKRRRAAGKSGARRARSIAPARC